MAESPRRYTLTLEAMPRDEPAEIRLRRALKCLLRSFGLRAIKVEEMPPPPEQERSE